MAMIHVHIGEAKTGTTSAQAAFMLSRQVLAENGYWYPVAAGAQNHTRLVRAMEPDLGSPRHQAAASQGPITREAWRAFRDEVVREFDAERARHAGADCIVSSEHFANLSPEGVADMKAFLAERFDRVRVYYYFRNPVDYEISIYSTRMKTGKTGHFRDRTQYNVVGRHTRLLRWETAFGVDNVEVIFFERSRLKNASIVDDLFSRIGIDPALAVRPRDDKNEALDMVALEILRHLNGGMFEALGLTPADRRKFERTLGRLTSDKRPVILPETAARINEAYGETVAYYSQRSGVAVDDILRTSRVASTGPTLETYELTVEDLLPVLVRLGVGATDSIGASKGEKPKRLGRMKKWLAQK